MALLERRWGGVGIPEATRVKLFSDIRVRFEVLFVLVGMRPDASRRISFGVDLSGRTEISVR